MIEYEASKGCGAINSFRSLSAALRLRTFRFPMLIGFLCASASAGMVAYMNYGEAGDFVQDAVKGSISDAAYSISASVLGFLLVFRTGQGYSRYNEGTRLIYQIMGSWFDAVSSLFAFCHGSAASTDEVDRFRHTVVRLVSLANAMMLADLEGNSTDVQSRTWGYSLIDAKGLDRKSLKLIVNSENKVEIIFQMLQICIINSVKTDVVSVSPPIIQRVFSDLSGAMLQFHEALKLEEVPFPFPYVAVTEILMATQTLMTPLIVSIKVDSILMAFVLTLLVVFTLWSMNAIAVAMDNPFREDENDLGGHCIQRAFNMRLMSIFVMDVEHVCTLSDKAARRVQQVQGRARLSNSSCRHSRGSTNSVHDDLTRVTHYLQNNKTQDLEAVIGQSEEPLFMDASVPLNMGSFLPHTGSDRAVRLRDLKIDEADEEALEADGSVSPRGGLGEDAEASDKDQAASDWHGGELAADVDDGGNPQIGRLSQTDVVSSPGARLSSTNPWSAIERHCSVPGQRRGQQESPSFASHSWPETPPVMKEETLTSPTAAAAGVSLEAAPGALQPLPASALGAKSGRGLPPSSSDLSL